MSKYLSNRGYEVINTILWVLAIAGMLCVLYELNEVNKDVKELRSIVNRK